MAKEPLNELEQAELEAKQLQNELARLELDKLRGEVETRKRNKERGAIDAAKAMEDRRNEQARCNHHTGGEGALAVVYGQGDEERPTAVSGIQFTDESIMLRCNRCGKKWHSAHRDGNEYYGAWAEGVQLFRKSQFKNIASVGGVKVTKTAPVIA